MSIKQIGLRLMAAAVTPLESILFGDAGPDFAPVFIIGLPRAGTTLVYQIYCHSFEASFPSRLTDYIPIAPALATRLSRLYNPSCSTDFTSCYGRAKGMAAPGEGTMWNLWFNKDAWYTRPDELSRRVQRDIRCMVGRIERQSVKPFVNKNLRHNHRIECLSGLFPKALFLVVLRDVEAVAASILRGRLDSRDAGKWFSIRPRRFPRHRKISLEQTCARQVKGIFDDLRSAIAAVGPERFGTVGYAGICAHPKHAVAAIKTFLQDRGLMLNFRHSPPLSFDVRRPREDSLVSGQMKLLRQEVQNIFDAPPFEDWPGVWLTPPDTERP